MKRNILLFIIFSMFIGCLNSKKNSEKVLTVTIEPQRFLLEQIVGNKFSVNTLVPPGLSPETFEPSPVAMMELGKSIAYFKVGFLGYENAWTKKLAENNPRMNIVDCSKGVDLIYEGHEHCSHDSNYNHQNSSADPHIWASTKNVMQMANNMLSAVISIDKNNTDFYRSNFKILAKKITETDSIISNLLLDIPSNSFIIYHPTLGYFARDYNLQQYSMEFEGKKPSPSQMKNLVDLAKQKNIKTIFIQQEFDTKNAEIIANELNIISYKINPLAYEWDKEMIDIAKKLTNNNFQK